MSSIDSEESDYTNITYGSGMKTRTGWSIKKFFGFFTVEPVVFFYALGFSLTMVITPVLYFEKTCKVSLVCTLT